MGWSGRARRRRLLALLVGVGLVALCVTGVAAGIGAPGATRAPASGVLLDVDGRGMARTSTFGAPPIWDLRYRYDCSGLGAPGNFAVTVVSEAGEAPDVAVNELGSGGEDMTRVHVEGRIHLEILSECRWHVIAED